MSLPSESRVGGLFSFCSKLVYAAGAVLLLAPSVGIILALWGLSYIWEIMDLSGFLAYSFGTTLPFGLLSWLLGIFLIGFYLYTLYRVYKILQASDENFRRDFYNSGYELETLPLDLFGSLLPGDLKHILTFRKSLKKPANMPEDSGIDERTLGKIHETIDEFLDGESEQALRLRRALRKIAQENSISRSPSLDERRRAVDLINLMIVLSFATESVDELVGMVQTGSTVSMEHKVSRIFILPERVKGTVAFAMCDPSEKEGVTFVLSHRFVYEEPPHFQEVMFRHALTFIGRAEWVQSLDYNLQRVSSLSKSLKEFNYSLFKLLLPLKLPARIMAMWLRRRRRAETLRYYDIDKNPPGVFSCYSANKADLIATFLGYQSGQHIQTRIHNFGKHALSRMEDYTPFDFSVFPSYLKDQSVFDMPDLRVVEKKEEGVSNSRPSVVERAPQASEESIGNGQEILSNEGLTPEFMGPVEEPVDPENMTQVDGHFSGLKDATSLIRRGISGVKKLFRKSA